MEIYPPDGVAGRLASALDRTAPDGTAVRRPGAASGEAASFASALGASDAVSRATSRNAPETFVKFEAMVLQTFLQSILPEETGTVYGGGFAGEMWKTLMAEKMAAVMAERGGIGIADRILSDYYLEGEQKVPVTGMSGGPDKEEADRQASLSTALVEELQRSFVKSIGEDHSGTSVTTDRQR